MIRCCREGEELFSDYKKRWRQHGRMMQLEMKCAVSKVVCAILWLMWI